MKKHITWFMAIVCALLCCLPQAAMGEEAAAFPERFDLRERGVVTPVKNQAPFGTCWAFGAIASIETSILSAMGATYDQTGLDLSEKQLGWFAFTPLPSAEDMAKIDSLAPYTSQAGEGLKPIVGGDNYFGTPYAVGGSSFLVTTLISSGIGPVSESRIPYKNKENMAVSNLREPSATVAEGQSVFDLPGGPDQYNLFIRESEFGNEEVRNCRVATPELIEQNALRNYAAIPAYSSDGSLVTPSAIKNADRMYDWSLPETDRLLSSMQLKETYILPTPAAYDEHANYRFNPDGVRAIKEQLMAGRAVCVSFLADASLSADDDVAFFMNKETWSHYTYDIENTGEVQQSNHVVSIVGWDDGWGVEKFSQGMTDKGVSKAPPAAGAWIVKNSWGAEGSGFPNEGTFGILDDEGRHTGYFYLSYYDRSLTRAEAFEFDVTTRTDSEKGITAGQCVSQYDFMPTTEVSTTYFEGDGSFANVFESFESQNVRALSVETAQENTHVTLELWRLREDSENPRDGYLLVRTDRDFRYGGYHRIDLDTSCFIDKGERFSVVATLTERDVDGALVYGVPFHQSPSKLYLENETSSFYEAYGIGVVNVGESYLHDDNKWVDWTEQIENMKASSRTAQYFEYDNFALKAFGDIVEACTVSFDSNGGSGAMDSVRVPKGQRYVLPACSFTPPAGKRFAGWDKGQAGQTIMVTGDMTLVATWQVGSPQSGPAQPAMPGRPSGAFGTYGSSGTYDTYAGSGGSGAFGTNGGSGTSGSTTAAWERLAGENRYATAAVLSSAAFARSGRVLLASGESFPDALCASALAGAWDCPIILTASGYLSNEARAEIERLGVSDVVIIGGEAAVSAAVEAEVEAMGTYFERIAGADRAATSVLALRRLVAGGLASDTVIVATGASFADALSIGPWSYATKSPIVLVSGGSISDDAIAAIREGGFTKAIIVGGERSVPASVESQLEGLSVSRLSGSDRYETSVAVATFAASNGLSWSPVFVASGESFPDALAGIPLVGSRGGVLLLARDGNSAAVDAVRAHASAISHGYVLGGEVPIPASILTALKGATSS